MTKPDEVPWSDSRVSNPDFIAVATALRTSRRWRTDDQYEPVVYVGRPNQPRRMKWEDR